MGRRKESDVERTHGHCADVLMSDFGIPKELRKQVSEEVAKVWVQISMIHSLIIASVRGFQPNPATRGLEAYLERHATHEQKHSKASLMKPREKGHYDSRGRYQEY